MGHDPTNKNLADAIAHDGDDSIIVAADIEYGEGRNVIGATEALSQIGKVDKSRTLRDSMPVTHRLFCFGVLAPEITKQFQ